MNCPKCGCPVEDDAKFCRNCGEKIIRDDASIEEKINEKVDMISEQFASGLNESFKDVADSFDDLKDSLSDSFKERSEEFEKESSEFAQKLKHFELKMILDKDFVDYGACIAVLLPVALFFINIFLSTSFAFVNGVLSYGPFFIFDLLRRVIYTISDVLSIVSIIFTAIVLGVLTYRFFKYEERDNATIFEMLAVALCLLGYFTSGIFSLAGSVIGIDTLCKVVFDKKSVEGQFDPNEDIEILKEQFNNLRTNIAQNKQTDEYVTRQSDEQYQISDSYFDGKGSDLFIKILVMVVLSVISCGLLTPYGLVEITRWEKAHTSINGRRLTFNGTAGQLWGLWIKWWFLSLITCGIYSFFAHVDYLKWVSSHTSYEGMLPDADGKYHNSRFEGDSFEFLGYSILTGIITSISCGLASPWMQCVINRWRVRNTVVENDRFIFNGQGSGLFVTWLVGALLTIITCGIYAPWYACKVQQFMISNTHVIEQQ